jgi:hypothetical protein
LPAEGELYGPDGTISLFADDQFCKAGVLLCWIGHIFPVNKENQIGILLNGPDSGRKVAVRVFAGPGFNGAAQLRRLSGSQFLRDSFQPRGLDN